MDRNNNTGSIRLMGVEVSLQQEQTFSNSASGQPTGTVIKPTPYQFDERQASFLSSLGLNDMGARQPTGIVIKPTPQKFDESRAGFLTSLGLKDKGKSTAPKKKQERQIKQGPTNLDFPVNVKDLLATGIFDGVRCKYVSWCRTISLKGLLNRKGYKCGCQKCNYGKILSAMEFERHAGTQTKHPNNNIYCKNGKSMYEIAKELRSVPRSELAGAFADVSGSIVNMRNLDIWKEKNKFC